MRQQPGHVPVRLARPPVPCTAPSVPRQLPIPRVLSLLLSWPRCRRKAGGGRAAVVSPGSPRTLPRCPRAPRAGNAFLSRLARPRSQPLAWDPLPRRGGLASFLSFPLGSAPRGGHAQDVSLPPAPPGLLPGSALPARPWSLFPETQVDKAPSVTCPPTSPLLPCLTASAGQALGGWRTGRGRGGGRRARGRARTTLARASRRGGFGGRRPRAAETTQAQGALRRRRWGD